MIFLPLTFEKFQPFTALLHPARLLNLEKFPACFFSSHVRLLNTIEYFLVQISEHFLIFLDLVNEYKKNDR